MTTTDLCPTCPRCEQAIVPSDLTYMSPDADSEEGYYLATCGFCDTALTVHFEKGWVKPHEELLPVSSSKRVQLIANLRERLKKATNAPTTPPKGKAKAYIFTKNDTGLQRTRIEDYCEKHGIEVLRTHNVFAKDMAQFQVFLRELVSDLEALTRKHKIILVLDKLDRLGPEFSKEFFQLTDLVKDGVLEIHCPKHEFKLTQNSPSAVLLSYLAVNHKR